MVVDRRLAGRLDIAAVGLVDGDEIGEFESEADRKAYNVAKKLNTAKYLERVLDSLCSDPVAVYATRTGNGQLVARDAVTALMPAETT